jgi:hypothetical protein
MGRRHTRDEGKGVCETADDRVRVWASDSSSLNSCPRLHFQSPPTFQNQPSSPSSTAKTNSNKHCIQ